MSTDHMPVGIADKERKYFDFLAQSLDPDKLEMTEENFERYRHVHVGPKGTAHEYFYHLLAPLEGKKVLDYGCGDGEHSCLLAACGGQVTAFDLSPVSVEKAKARAAINNLADRITFEVHEAGATGYPSGAFDIVAGVGILHHLTMCLPAVLEEISRVLATGGMAVFLEPVNPSPWLRRFRKLVPVKANGTEDERSLNEDDLALLSQHFTVVEHAYFRCLARADRFFGERANALLRPVDHQLVRMFPFLSRFYGISVIRMSKGGMGRRGEFHHNK